MSRIEQIIGRAVRNCSHKDLPFELRNVEIFLYGSLLEEDTEEAADLYLYRLAEIKAVQMGKVNRVLKEIAIDCLLNSEQMNFTAEKMQQTVKQVLSNRETIDYQIGDKPYTTQCDYMESCVYKCKPVNEIGEINELSYSEPFVNMNTEKIIHRIRQLFKDGYFYNKDKLIKHINIIKPYPSIQINAALTQLVDDKNEFITDKFGRLGNLVNIGEYYLFQPTELTDKNISLYDRSVPIPFKHSSITVDISKDLQPAQIKADAITQVLEDVEAAEAEDDSSSDEEHPLLEEVKAIESIQSKPNKLKIKQPISIPTKSYPGKEVVKLMEADYINGMGTHKIVRGEKNYYKIFSEIKTDLRKEGAEEAVIEDLLISNIIDMQLFGDIFNVLEYIYSLSELTDFEQKIKNYFDGQQITNGKITGLVLQGWSKKPPKAIQQLLILQDGKWSFAQPEDEKDLFKEISNLIIPKKNLGPVVGFITSNKNEYMTFKVKLANVAGNKGARCEQAKKPEIIKSLNTILDETKFTPENTKSMTRDRLCIFQEFLLRLYSYREQNGKQWFLNPALAVIINIESL